MLKWDFTALSTEKYETNVHEIHEDVTDIAIVTNTADILLVPSDDDSVSVTCYEQKDVRHTVTAKDGALIIEVKDTRKWYQHIGIFFSTPKITVSLPRGVYGALSVSGSTGDVSIAKDFTFKSMDIATSTGDITCYASVDETVKIRVSTGDICVADLSANALNLTASTGNIKVSSVVCDGDMHTKVSTGKVHLSDVTCLNLTGEGSTGDLRLTDVVAEGKITIERSTGDIVFDGCDAAELAITTDTGDVSGTLLSHKIFMVDTDTGRVEVPKSTTGGLCEIRTDTGDIIIEIDD